MNDELTTVDRVMEFLREKVEQHEPIAPGVWVDCAQKLVLFMGEESDRLYELQQSVARIKVAMLEATKEENVSAVKLRIETQPEWLAMMKQKSKIDRIVEFIRVAKLQARIRMEEYKGQ